MKSFVLTTLCVCYCMYMNIETLNAQTPVTVTQTATAASDVPTGSSSFTWSTPSGAESSGGGTANAQALLTLLSGSTDYLQLTGFGFNIPVGSTITGITAAITHQASGLSITVGVISLTGSVNDNIVSLIGPGITNMTNEASMTSWTTSPTTATYGGPTYTWGTTPWTTAIVNNPGFGIEFSASLIGSSLLGVSLLPGAAVDVISLSITYLPPTTLPIQLEQWKAVRQGSSNLLTWTASVTDLPGSFIVQRSANGTSWQNLDTLAAPVTAATSADAGNGNGSAATSGDGTPGPTGITGTSANFSYTDHSPVAGGPSYYRLCMHTPGLTDTWSSIQAIAGQSAAATITCYPNPVHDMINVTATQAFKRLSLTDIQGRTLWVQEYAGGVTNAQISVSAYPPGLYFVQVDGVPYKLVKN